MPSLLSGINLSLQAMLAHQQSIEVIEHNVANANTPGYHRQSAVLSAGVPTSFSNLMGFYSGDIGTGVTVDYIQRTSLDFFDTRFRNQVSDSKRWDLESRILSQVEATMSETTSDGLVAKLNSFWNGWQNLSVDPSNTTLRADVLQRSKDLAGAITGRYTQLTQIQKDQNLGIVSRVNDINSIADQVARLNIEITHMLGTNQQPNDLMDKRDSLVDRLAQLSGSRADLQPNGMVIVSIGGHTLVGGADYSKIEASTGALTTTLNWQNDNQQNDDQPFNPTTGELAGLLDLAGSTPNVIQTYQNSLNQLATALIQQVNGLFNPTQTSTDNNFFVDDGPLHRADSIQVNLLMDKPENFLPTTMAGDGRIATAIAALQNTSIANLGSVSGISMNEFYTQKVAEFGIFTRQAKDYSHDKGLVLKALDQQRQSIEGVSLDEEAANLMKSQKAFEAATRMVSVMDSLLDKIINGMGAGR